MSVLRVNKIAASGQTSENTGSVFFDDSGDRLDIAIGTDLDLGTADFTIELWWYKADSGNNYAWTLGDAKLSTGLELYVGSTGTVTKVYTNNGSQIDAATNPSANEWHHYAVVRESGTLKLYIDGVQDPSTYDASSADFGGAGGFLYIGAEHYDSAFNYDGLKYISNFRVVKGKALYTSNFAPPTTELEVTPETVLVACYDGENIFAEKTGKIIAAYGDRSSGIHTVGESPIGITTNYPAVTRSVDVTAGPVLQGNLEYNSQNFLVLPKGTTTERFPNFAGVDAASARGVFFGGIDANPNVTNTIDYVTVSTTGTVTDFGDTTGAKAQYAACASPTRGIKGGGSGNTSGTESNTIEYVTILSTGNGQDFGDLTAKRANQPGGASNSTRGIFAQGYTGTPGVNHNSMDYITMSSMGNAIDFGDMSTTGNGTSGVSSPTRAIFMRSGTNMEYVVIASTGNSVDFGVRAPDPGQSFSNCGSCSSSTRGLFGGTSPGGNTIQFITMATLGDAEDFGDLFVPRRELGATSSKIRGIWAGGNVTRVDMDYVTIATAGDALDFGDLTVGRRGNDGCSNGHGGLG